MYGYQLKLTLGFEGLTKINSKFNIFKVAIIYQNSQYSETINAYTY